MAARGRLVVNPTLQLTALADVSRRGTGRDRVEITDARVLRLLLAAATGGRRPRLDGRLTRQLERDGILVRPARIPRNVHLDSRLAPPAHSPAGTRVWRGPGLPPDLARRVAISEPFLPAGDILWVRQAGSGIELPYALTPALARNLRRGALGTPGPGERTAWQGQVRTWRRELRTQGHAILRNLFPQTFMAAVRAYYRRVEREGYLLAGDARRHGQPQVQDEPLLAFLGAQLAAVVRQVTGERVPSTFSFLRIYEAGAVLARHRDHPACRWNIDLVVGGAPAPSRATAWPLRVATRSGRRTVRLGLGDGVLYRGTHLTHWRAAQPAGRSTVLACLHYGRGRSRS